MNWNSLLTTPSTGLVIDKMTTSKSPKAAVTSHMDWRTDFIAFGAWVEVDWDLNPRLFVTRLFVPRHFVTRLFVTRLFVTRLFVTTTFRHQDIHHVILSPRLFVCVCEYVCLFEGVFACACVTKSFCLRVCFYMCVCVCVSLCVCICVCLSISVCVCECVLISVYVSVCGWVFVFVCVSLC